VPWRSAHALAFFGVFDPNDEPIGFGKPLDSREYHSRTTIELSIDLVLARLRSDPKLFSVARRSSVGKQVQVRVKRETMKLQPLHGARIGKQNPSRAVGTKIGCSTKSSRLASRPTGSVSLACDSSIGPRFKIDLLGHLSAFSGAGNPI